MTAPRYRLNLTAPLFELPPPDPVKLRGLTETELDVLARCLRRVTTALRRYDAALGRRLEHLAGLADPWWAELRPELLRRGFTPQVLDDCVGSASGTNLYYGSVDIDTGKA